MRRLELREVSLVSTHSSLAFPRATDSFKSLVPTVSVVVPVYNSHRTLGDLVTRLTAVLDAAASRFELILVNDASQDASWSVICDLATQCPHIHGIDLLRNYGQHNALLAGIRAARYEVIVTLDDDLQHPPEEIPRLLAKLAEGYDVVYGQPEHEQHSIRRALASQMTKLAIQSAAGAETARLVSAFRAFRTQIRDAFADYHSPFVSIDVLLTWGTTRFAAIRVRHDPRRVGTSNYTFFKLLTHAINMTTGFSIRPLQLASLLGFSFTIAGLVLLVYVLTRYLIEGGTVPGFAFLASVIVVFSGVQLFAIGTIGEYLARMHLRMMAKPAYTVRQRVLAPQK